MAEESEPFGGWSTILNKVSSPTDLGIIFTLGPIAFLFWFFLAPAVAAALPAATFAILIAVLGIGVKKLAVDRRRERTPKPELPEQRYFRLRALQEQDVAESPANDRSRFERLAAETRSYHRVIASGLAHDSDITEFIDGQLTKRQKLFQDRPESAGPRELH